MRAQLLIACALCAIPRAMAQTPATAAEPARSNDVLILNDGRILKGHRLERTQDGMVVHFEHGDVNVPAALILDALIEGEIIAPQSEEERSELAKGRVRFEGRWMSVAQRDGIVKKRIEERHALIQDQIDHSTWGKRKKQEAKSFAWEHVLPANVYERYSSLMDVYFDQFVKEWKIKVPKKDGKLLVCFYKDHPEMVQVGGAPGGVLGYFRFVEPLELDFFYDRLDPRFTEEVMFHETNHYLQSLIDKDFDYPHFPGESLAEYYGASRFDMESGKVETGLVLESRLVEIQDDVLNGEMMPLERLVLTAEYEHYNWGWSLIHFLMSDPKTERAFRRFFIGLATDGKVQRVSAGRGGVRTCEPPEIWRYLKECLGAETPEALRKVEMEWHDYVKAQLEFVSPMGKSRAAERAAMEGRRLRAKRLHDEALDEGGRSDPLILHRAARFHMGDGRPGEAIGLWRAALALAPLEAEFYAWLGSALRRSKDTEAEGIRLQLLALEIDPYNERAALDIDLSELRDGPEEGEGPAKPPKGN